MYLEEQLYKLNELTNEADMLTSVLHDALQAHVETDNVCGICHLSDIVCKKMGEIRRVF